MPKEVENISFDLKIKNYAKIRRFLWSIPTGQINNYIKVSKRKTSKGGEALQLPLQLACSLYRELGSDLALIKSLIEKGADINARTDYSSSPISIIAISGNVELAKLLIENGAELNPETSPPLIRACLNSNCMPMIQLLIDNGADVNKASNKTGMTPLHLAAENAEVDIVQLLLDNGAKVNIKDNDGDTALMKAARKNNLNMAEMLLKNGASIDSESEAWKNIFALDNLCVQYIKKVHENRGVMPMLQQTTLNRDEKLHLPKDLIQEVYGVLTNVRKPKKPPTGQ